jgi:hypothetical protein
MTVKTYTFSFISKDLLKSSRDCVTLAKRRIWYPFFKQKKSSHTGRDNPTENTFKMVLEGLSMNILRLTFSLIITNDNGT